jgi:acetoin utilization deacetylase AcuC-like enzyme
LTEEIKEAIESKQKASNKREKKTYKRIRNETKRIVKAHQESWERFISEIEMMCM